MSDQPQNPTLKKMKRPAWLKRCSAPVRFRVEELIVQDGYFEDPDLWIADMLTTAQRSPQGYVLRFGSLKRSQAKELTQESLANAELFSVQGGVKTRRANHEPAD